MVDGVRRYVPEAQKAKIIAHAAAVRIEHFRRRLAIIDI
jgi:hypothetical protein